MKPIKDTSKDKVKITIKSNTMLRRALPDIIIDTPQKIVKAVYLITDFLSETEKLRSMIRSKAIESMQFLLDSSRFGGDLNYLEKGHHSLYELLSYLDIAYRIGYISEMNYSILSKEIRSLQNVLIAEIEKTENKNKNPHISLSDLFSSHGDITDFGHSERVKESSSTIDKKVSINELTQTSLKSQSHLSKTQKISEKEKRHKHILDILKQKKDASIKDVCSLFKDCSSKTIQRDLKELIKNRKVVKRGERRWVVYNLA